MIEMADEAEVVLDDKLCSELIALTMENLRHANLNNVQVEAVLINCLVGLYMTLSPHLHRPQVEFMANKVFGGAGDELPLQQRRTVRQAELRCESRRCKRLTA